VVELDGTIIPPPSKVASVLPFDEPPGQGVLAPAPWELRPKTFSELLDVEEAGAVLSGDVLAMLSVTVGLDLRCAQLALTPKAIIPQINAAVSKNLIFITRFMMR
jgi:hypothetical protein